MSEDVITDKVLEKPEEKEVMNQAGKDLEEPKDEEEPEATEGEQ